MNETSLRIKKAAPLWVVAVMLIVLLVWGYVYLFILRPAMNAWLAHYISWYPAVIHVVPILAVPIFIGMLLTSIFGTVPQPAEERQEDLRRL